MTLNFAIAGVAGRMGQTLVRTLSPIEGVRLSGATERSGSPSIGRDAGEIAGLPTIGVPAVEAVETAAAGADVWVDFTSPAASLAALAQLRQHGVRAAVIGATGFTPDQEAQVARLAADIAVVKSGNFSLGVNLLTALIEQAAARLGPDWDIEIHETHHRMKADAPSGTALMLGEAAAKGRGGDLSELRSAPYDGITGPRTSGAIGFSVTRAGGVVGDHEAVLASESEMLTLGHRALDRSIFARGAIHAGRWAAERGPGLYAMRDVLSL